MVFVVVVRKKGRLTKSTKRTQKSEERQARKKELVAKRRLAVCSDWTFGVKRVQVPSCWVDISPVPTPRGSFDFCSEKEKNSREFLMYFAPTRQPDGRAGLRGDSIFLKGIFERPVKK
jgi:hypothetical protein